MKRGPFSKSQLGKVRHLAGIMKRKTIGKESDFPGLEVGETCFRPRQVFSPRIRSLGNDAFVLARCPMPLLRVIPTLRLALTLKAVCRGKKKKKRGDSKKSKRLTKAQHAAQMSHARGAEKKRRKSVAERKRKMSGLKVRMERPHRTPTKLGTAGESPSFRCVCRR